MFKKTVIICFLLPLFFLVSCSGGSYTITVGDVDATSNGLSGNYNSFSGHYFKKVKIEEGEVLHVDFTTHTENGSLIAKVFNEEEEPIFTLQPGDSVSIDQAGTYKLQVEGKEHNGSFLLSW